MRTPSVVVLLAASCFADDWHVVKNVNDVKGLVDSPGANSSQAKLIGKFPSVQACQDLCDATRSSLGCGSFAYFPAGTSQWATMCYARVDGLWDPIAQTNVISGYPGQVPPPSPTPPTPSGTSSKECVVKQQALLFAERLNKRAVDHVFASLAFPTGCPAPALSAKKEKITTKSTSQNIYVSPTGDDTQNGLTETTALKSLHTARDLVRTMSPGVTVNLLPGVHYLSGSLNLGERDSGIPGRPNVWEGSSDAPTSLSGNVNLNCSWQASERVFATSGVLQCTVPAGVEDFAELFVDGVRQTRARYPNGDQLKPRDGYADGCKVLELIPNPSVAYPLNSSVYSATGKFITKMTNPAAHITVSDATSPRTLNNGKTDQTLYHSTRFNETYNHPFFNDTSLRSVNISAADVAERMASWKNPSNVVVKMYHPNGWGSWAFETEKISGSVMTFSRGGNQEGRGGESCGKFYVENVAEELDVADEWYYDTTARTLYYKPDAQTYKSILSGNPLVAEVPQQKTLFSAFGSTMETPVHDLTLRNVNVTGSAPTYLDSYEIPSGGDWSVHRGAAVFVQNAERISVDNVKFDQVGGNAVFFSSYVVNSSVTNSDFWRTGDSAILAVGSTKLADALSPTFPQNTIIDSNWIDTVGVYMKQTSCYFKSITSGTIISNNLCYNGPRAGINFNDGFAGGDVVSGNLVFNMVRESGDHGTFNSWDRRDWVWRCIDDATKLCFLPKPMHITRNMWIGPAGWNVDHDDGSSYYFDSFNTVYLGTFKYRDGDMRNMSNNLMIDAAPAFQVAGYETDYFLNNEMLGHSQVCGPKTLGGLSGTVYLKTENETERSGAFQDATQCDPGTNTTITWEELGKKIQALWP